MIMGARSGTVGTCPPPWYLKKVTSYSAFLRNFPLALAIRTLKFSLEHREKRTNFRLRLRVEKWSALLSVGGSPLLEKILRAPMIMMT